MKKNEIIKTEYKGNEKWYYIQTRYSGRIEFERLQDAIDYCKKLKQTQDIANQIRQINLFYNEGNQ